MLFYVGAISAFKVGKSEQCKWQIIKLVHFWSQVIETRIIFDYSMIAKHLQQSYQLIEHFTHTQSVYYVLKLGFERLGLRWLGFKVFQNKMLPGEQKVRWTVTLQ